MKTAWYAELTERALARVLVLCMYWKCGNVALNDIGGNIAQFVMNATGMFWDDAMLRRVTESVMIG